MEKAYKAGKGIELIKDGDSPIYRATVHMCPGGTSFKIGRAQGSKKKTLGLLPGPMHWKIEERNDNAAKGGKGDLTQYGPEVIPGPEVEADYEVTVDMESGTVKYVCTGDMCAPKGPEVYVPEDPVLEKESAFVHLFGWRWPDVAMECEQFLGPKGYKGVQIQPPQESKVPKPGRNFSWNYVYRPVSYKLHSNLGTPEQYSEMVQRCKTAGVDIYADAVINHMSGGGGSGVTGAKFKKRSFPDVINGEGYSPEDFHHLPDDPLENCQIKFGGLFETACDPQCMMECDFPGLPDLDTASPKVRGMITSYLNLLMDEDVAGFRVDAADHIGSTDLKAILDPMPHKRFRFFESRDEEDYLEKIKLGRVTQFKFKRNLMKSIVKEDLSKINFIGPQTGLVPSEAAVVFVLNHDNLMEEDHSGEGIFYRSPVIYTLGNVIMLALPYGYPKVISSFYFPLHEHNWPPPYNNVHGENGELRCGDDENWVCEHRWPAIANMVAWRKSAGTNDITLWTPGESKSQVYFCRGHEACILVNSGKEDWTVTPNLSLPPGDYCDIIESDDVTACRLMNVDDEGHAHWKHGDATQVVVPAQSAIAVHVGVKV
jgi:alpha-amylase